jgi:hypothetical protein
VDRPKCHFYACAIESIFPLSRAFFPAAQRSLFSPCFLPFLSLPLSKMAQPAPASAAKGAPPPKKPSTLFKDTHPKEYEEALRAPNPGVDLGSLTTCSGHKVWFRCSLHTTCDEHVWNATIASRTFGRTSGCQFCSARVSKFCRCDIHETLASRPDLVAEIHPTLNPGLEPRSTFLGSNKRITWLCTAHTTCKEHVWTVALHHRTQDGSGCPFCAGQRGCSCDGDGLLINNKEMMSQLLPEDRPQDLGSIRITSHRILTWTCNQHDTCDEHVWEAMASNRTMHGQGCPFCSNKRVCSCTADTLLLARQAEPMALLDEILDDIETIRAGSTRILSWKCSKGHKWKTGVANQCRRAGSGCRECDGTISGMELSARNVFRELGHEAIEQHRFPECRDKQPLLWDFWLPQLNMLVETDGKQHFVDTPFFASSTFAGQRARDATKTRYATGRHHLLRISYSSQSKIASECSAFITLVQGAPSGTFLQRFVGREYETDEYKNNSM